MASVYIQFRGTSQTTSAAAQFSVMVGDNPPLIKGGYAKYVTVDRPLQRGLTVFTGYDPMSMDVEVRFGVTDHQAWSQSDAAGQRVEHDINILEWMGGVNFSGGPPPLVYVYARDGNGKETNLIPPPAKNGRPWTITDIAWGVSYRNSHALRVWQEAVVSLQSYIGLHPIQWGAPPGGTNGAYVPSAPTRDTPLKIANGATAKPNAAAPSATTANGTLNPRVMAQKIMADPRNNPCRSSTVNLAGKSLSWKIPAGTAVWVPLDQGAFNPENDIAQINPLTSLV